jgi:hypothetical protein
MVQQQDDDTIDKIQACGVSAMPATVYVKALREW